MQDQTVPQSTTTGGDPRQAAWQIVIGGIAAGMPLPEMAGVHSFGVLEIQVSDNDTASVDAWQAHLGLPAPTLSEVMRASRRFRTYEAKTQSLPELRGWGVKVLSFIDEPAEDGTR